MAITVRENNDFKIINDILPADSGEIKLGSKVTIGYYDQEHHVLDPDKTLFDELQDAYPDLNNTQIRNTLAAFCLRMTMCLSISVI